MARTKQTARKFSGRPLLEPAVVFLMYQLHQAAPRLEAAAAAGDVATLEHLLLTAASGITNRHEGPELGPPPLIQLAIMSPVPAAVECLVAAGASVLGEDPTVSAWERTYTTGPARKVSDWKAYRSMFPEEGPVAALCEEHKQYSCLLLAAHHSPSLDMVRLLTRITLQQAKQQQQQQQQQEEEQQVPWRDVLYGLVKAPMACNPRRGALVLQQLVELEGLTAAAGVVTQLLDEYSRLRQDSSQQECAAVDALTHLAQVLLLVWLGGGSEVMQQRDALVNPLQQACGVLLLKKQQASGQEDNQVPMPASWEPVRTALQTVVAATVAAADDGLADGGSDAGEAADALQEHQQWQEQQLHDLEMQVEDTFVQHAARVGACAQVAAGDTELLEHLQSVEDFSTWAAADILAELLNCFIAEGKHALVEAAVADLCRALLAAWLGAQEQLRQEMVDAVVRAAQVMVKCK
jgi:hypothetical protein